MSAEANFVRVRILRSADTHSLHLPVNVLADSCSKNLPLYVVMQLHVAGYEKENVNLLCVVRSVLKKIKNHVLVGDVVKVISVDWTDERGALPE